MKKTYLITGAVLSAIVLASCGSSQEVAKAQQPVVEEVKTEVEEKATEVVEEVKEEALGKIVPVPNLNGDIVLNVTLPENTTAINLYRKAEGESDYQLVYQAWGKNEDAKSSRGKKIEIIDYFVEKEKKYDYKCNFRLLNDPNQIAYDQKNIGGLDSNEITIIPLNGYGDFKLTNTPAATYDKETSQMTFTVLPETDIDSVKLPEGLEKQPIKFVYVNPELYGLWIYSPESTEVPVFITLGKIEGIDSPADPKAVMLDTELRSDDGDGGWRLSIDKTSPTTTDGWTYEEHWYRKYTGNKYGLPARIVIPASAVQKTENPETQPDIDAK
ncbi:MAG: hypothetical protein IJS09_03955 [Treponema sp.]|nr:hypothetical protein [Treponema sp.]